MNILAIDESKKDQRLIEKYACNAQVCSINNEDDLKNTNPENYGLIIIDMNTSFKNAYELYRELKPLTKARFVITSKVANFHEVLLDNCDIVIGKSKLLKQLPMITKNAAY